MSAESGFIFKKVFPVILAFVVLVSAACMCFGPLPGPPQQPTATSACVMSFITPQVGSALPLSGPVNFSWTPIPAASFYLFSVFTPDGGEVNYTQNGTSRTVYMENYKTGGTYRFNVQARDAANNILCQAEIDFDKDQFVQPKPNFKPNIALTVIPPK